jgi:ketopantoate reductase
MTLAETEIAVGLPSQALGKGVKGVAVIDALSPDMRASISLDLRLGRPLELPWLAGAVIDLGSKKGIPTPILAKS